MTQWQRWRGVMKAYPFEEKRLSKWVPPYIVQPKLDGVRCRAIPLESGEYMLLSSEENTIFSVPHINEMLGKTSIRAELDGELYCHGKTFEEIVSITSRTVNLHPDHQQIEFHCFDVINELPQLRRTLQIEDLRGLSPYLVIAPFWACENLEDVLRAYDKVIEQGYEGIIVREIHSPYVRKRSTQVMKFKPKQSDEYKILGFKEEISKDGEEKGSLGALICDSGDGHTFDVGSGFKREQRAIFWEMREVLPGRICKVKYQHITSGNKVPRFPVFISIEDY